MNLVFVDIITLLVKGYLCVFFTKANSVNFYMRYIVIIKYLTFFSLVKYY